MSRPGVADGLAFQKQNASRPYRRVHRGSRTRRPTLSHPPRGALRMTSETDIDGRIGQGWGGVSPNGAHVNVVLGRRGSPTAAALMTTFTAPSPGHTPVLVCVGADQPSYEAVVPPTIMMNKATTTTERHQTMTFGAAQLGIGQGV